MSNRKYTIAEKSAIQQFTGMTYSEGRNVQALCIGMNLKQDEWDRIKDDCSWLSEFAREEIENYLLDIV